MANYPSAAAIRRKTTVTPINPALIDQADGGGIRVASLAAIQRYRIDVLHPFVESDEVDELMGFWTEYQNTEIALVRGSRMIYQCPFVHEPEIEEASGTYYNVRVRLEGRRIPSVVPAGYGSFESSPTTYLDSANATVSFDTTVKKFGAQSMKVTKSLTDGVSCIVNLTADVSNYNAVLTANRKWLAILSVRMSVARAVAIAMVGSPSVTGVTSSSYTPAAADTWYRFARYLDFTSKSDTAGRIRIIWNSAAQSGETLHVDGLSMFDVTDYTDDINETTFISQYIPPEP